MEKLYYTVGEVADILSEESTTVRFWANTFSRYVRPERNAKGNRMFRQKDVECMKQIRHLVRVDGLTLDGVARKLAADRGGLEGRMKIVNKLQDIRSMLEELQESL